MSPFALNPVSMLLGPIHKQFNNPHHTKETYHSSISNRRKR